MDRYRRDVSLAPQKWQKSLSRGPVEDWRSLAEDQPERLGDESFFHKNDLKGTLRGSFVRRFQIRTEVCRVEE
jgi:hypothetical protein